MANPITKSIFSFSLLLCLLIAACGQSQSQSPPTPELPPVVAHPPVVILSPTPVPPCPDDMVLIEPAHFCIDRYEAPNQKGALPFAAQTAYQGEAYCASVGKELCTRIQWTIACMGTKHKVYPYGNIYKRGTCNDDKIGWIPVPWNTMGTPAWTKWCKSQYKAEPSGSRPACISDYGVFDMTGNTAEWVRDPTVHYRYVVKGGYWYGVMFGTPTCKFSNRGHPPSFDSYEFGYRCCKSAN